MTRTDLPTTVQKKSLKTKTKQKFFILFISIYLIKDKSLFKISLLE